MKILASFATVLMATVCVNAGDFHTFTKSADAFLKKYVSNGSVAYAKIKSNEDEIANLYNTIGTISLKGLDDSAKKAFYINAYNLVVIYSIIQNYPVKSPMDITGFFDMKKHLVAGELLTLNALEKERLLAIYKDARFHFVLVCAAKSCPPLMAVAFTADQIEEQIEQRVKLTVNNNDWLRVHKRETRVAVSKIFEWYNDDFTRNEKSLLDWINNYRISKIPASYKVEYYEYDWTLNE